MSARIFIVEDEIIHFESLKLSIEEAGYSLCGYCDNADNAFDLIQELQPQVVLVDIALPGINNGITLAKKINSELAIPHIFTTSFTQDEIIKQAVTTNPSGYLKKPVETSNLKAAIEIALKKDISHNSSNKEGISDNLIFTRIGDRLVKIPVADIQFVKADGDNFVSVFLNNREIACRISLINFLKQLPQEFIQIHRSAIVNLNSISEINEKEQVAIIGNHQVPIGRKYRKVLLSRLKKI